MKTWLKVLLPLLLIAAGALAARSLVLSRKPPETQIPEPPLPLVRAEWVELKSMQMTVPSQGTVAPRTESMLVPEVSGRVTRVSPTFAAGGFFEEGEALVRVDPLNYEEALVQARTLVTQALLRLAREEAEADVAREEWADIGEGGVPPPLILHEPQMADARAALEAARAAVRRAERDLDRTEIRAPYAGRVREKLVDVGQFVTVGTPVARIYAVDYAEIRLPLKDDDLAFVDLPLDYRGDRQPHGGPRVVLRAHFARQTFEWEGRIVRTGGEIDPQSRMVYTVARVKDPYGRGDEPGRPPLAAGMFVEAEILGRTFPDITVLPRSAVRNDGTVMIIDADDRLRFREIEILRTVRDRVIVGSGLRDGERVCLTPLATVTDGMRVRVDPGSGREESS
jgi:RND family efflux transporter MFP subunit